MTTQTALRCKRCDCPHVTWQQRRDGSHYLAIKFDMENMDSERRAWVKGGAGRRPHPCGNCGACFTIAQAPMREAINAYRASLMDGFHEAMETARQTGDFAEVERLADVVDTFDKAPTSEQAELAGWVA